MAPQLKFEKNFIWGKFDEAYSQFIKAAALVYFHRANFKEEDFTVENFFVALHVANDFLEDTWYQGNFQKKKKKK